ncbi:succinylglutamate desuccinylase/aspartoacylase family protein [Lawsonibacter sp. JLR.KK007]|uniref:succinylglutamate desuccinylase/aspartoacylase family protein n=1 Tax=Lawsonibacter sp. JLR.KK007 TaxID=3114293 RepID=UPI002FF051A7
MYGRSGSHNRIWLPALAAGGLILFLALRFSPGGAPEQYTLLPGSEMEVPVYVQRGGRDGPTVYVVGGTHGDETAGWQAAAELRRTKPEAGTLYVAAPLNAYGAEHNQRKTREERDLNRNFPGNPEGCDAERIAWAVYQDIQEKDPDLVLDLHEAKPPEGTRDDLRSSLICQDMRPVADLILDLLEEFGTDSRPLTLYGSPPQGSLNRTVTEQLGIPVITIETGRDEALSSRVRQQLDIVEFTLTRYGMRSEQGAS